MSQIDNVKSNGVGRVGTALDEQPISVLSFPFFLWVSSQENSMELVETLKKGRRNLHMESTDAQVAAVPPSIST